MHLKERLIKVKLKDETTYLRKSKQEYLRDISEDASCIWSTPLPTYFRKHNAKLCRWYKNIGKTWRTSDSCSETSRQHQWDWANKRRIKANQNRSTHILFTLRNQTCPKVKMDNVALPQKYQVKNLGKHIHRRLTRAKHSKAKRNQLKLQKK